jgi:hypothetical protein
MQMSPGGPQRVSPDQLLDMLAPIVHEGMRTAEAGTALPYAMREAILAAFLVGRGVAPSTAISTVTQWRTSGMARGLMRAQTPTGMPSQMGAPTQMGTPTQMEQIAPGAERVALVPRIEKFIQDQVNAAAFYTQMMEQAEDPSVREYIQHARDDERKHARMLQDLYRSFTGRTFDAQVQPVQFANLAEGLKRAMDDEYEAMEEYRDVYLSTGNARIRNVFFELMTDELEHATRFNYALDVVTRS